MQAQPSDLDDEQWWSSLDNGQLVVPWCSDCDRSWLRMTPTCPRCGGATWKLRPISPTGRLYSWVTIHRALDEEFVGQEPYTVGVVELDGGARIHARIIGSEFQSSETIRLVIDSKGATAVPIGYPQHEVTPA